MSKWLFCFLIVLSIVSAAWETVDCKEKTVVKAINFAESKIKEKMGSSSAYRITNTMHCKKETVEQMTYYGLSVYGVDATSKYYVHNVISHQSITGDFVLDSNSLVASKSLAEQSQYPWQGTLY